MNVLADALHEIIVVDDESTVLGMLSAGLKADNFRVTALTRPQEAATAVAERRPCLVILDMNMPGMNGLEVLKRIKDSSPEVPVVLISGQAEAEDKSEARRLGACDFLDKPINWNQLRNIAYLSLFLQETKKNERRLS